MTKIRTYLIGKRLTKTFSYLVDCLQVHPIHTLQITYYHQPCYVKPWNSAHAVGQCNSLRPASPSFDAQIIVLFGHSNTNSFKLSGLQLIYRQPMNEQGDPCQDKKEPNLTRFKVHLLKFLPGWVDLSKGIDVRKSTYICNKGKVTDKLVQTHISQVGQEDALILMRSTVMTHTDCLQSQVPFDGYFPPNCLTFPVNEKMRIFLMLCSVVHQHLTDVI